jgi:hypothetical protein
MELINWSASFSGNSQPNGLKNSITFTTPSFTTNALTAARSEITLLPYAGWIAAQLARAWITHQGLNLA